MPLRKLTLLCSLLIITFVSSAQNSVSVNPLTGSANVVIPVYDISRGAVDCPISLIYNSKGVKPKDVESTAGMNWTLQVGGSVSRQVKGLPDDCNKDNAGNSITGWMYNSTGASAVNGFIPANTGTGVNCTNETTDITYITNHFSYTADTEPDQFYVSAPGLSCSLYYDVANSKFVTVPYQDLKITYTTDNVSTDATYKQIISFSIVNDQGITYSFSVPESVTQSTPQITAPNFFKSTYYQYKNGVTFYDNWYLKSMTDVNGNGIIYNYATYGARLSSDPVQLYIYQSTGYVQNLLYKIYTSVTQQTLTSIQTVAVNTTPQIFTLNWISAGTGQAYISSILGAGRFLSFNYNKVTSTGSAYTRSFLSEFTDIGTACSSPIDYKFSYSGVTATTTILPDSTSTDIDYWGYYSTKPSNGSLMPAVFASPATSSAIHPYQAAISSANSGYTYKIPGTDRSADATVITTASLSQITYAQGGSTSIVYEPNDFYDPTSAAVVQGGGIRVKTITDYDGINTANNVVRNYTYTDGSGVSTGKPQTLPEYAFAIPYSGSATGLTLYEYATALSATDLSEEDHSIMYGLVTLSQSNVGKSTYQYYLPGMNWDSQGECYSCSTADWAPTLNYAARMNCTPSYGPVKNSIYSYPFTPNTNYDFERGLLQKSVSYDTGSNEVSESDYTYQRTGMPGTIAAFRYDDNTNTNTIRAYAKYNIYTSAGELSTQVVKKLYNAGNLITTTSNYTYGAAQHKLAQSQTTNSDGSVLTSKIKYVKDYTVTSGAGDPNVAALYNMQQLNINAPVETQQQIQNSSGTFTTGAALTLYNSFAGLSANNNLPSQVLKFSVPAGVTDFVPFAIASNVKSYDSRYVPVANMTAYDDYGILLTADDNNHNQQTTLTDHLTYRPVAVFKNAAFAGVGFNDFDSSFPFNSSVFTPSGTSGPVTGSHTGLAYGFTTGQNFTASIVKTSQDNNYIFSIWMNSGTSSGTLTITLTSPHTTLTYSKGYGTLSAWKYYEWKLPVSTLDNGFTVTFTATSSIGVDDILFYPEKSEATTFAYDSNFYNTAATNTNGVSAYFSYDIWGRLLYAYDQDKNIIKKNSYITPADKQNFANANSFTVSGSPVSPLGEYWVNTVVTFTAGAINSCNTSGLTYTWNFGDGTGNFVTTTPTETHTYTTAGSYSATLTTTSPLFGSETATPQTVKITSNVYASILNSTSGATGIDDVDFYQAGTLVYHFAASGGTIGNASVPRGTYDVKVTAHGPANIPHSSTGYSSITMVDDMTTSCQDWLSNPATYTFSGLNLSACYGISFKMKSTLCP